jgi:hypothetical protein
MITVRSLIKQLGGPSEIAARCGISASAVSNWGSRGEVAAGHRITLWRMASEAGLDWTPPDAEGLQLTPREAA